MSTLPLYGTREARNPNKGVERLKRGGIDWDGMKRDIDGVKEWDKKCTGRRASTCVLRRRRVSRLASRILGSIHVEGGGRENSPLPRLGSAT
jgi:hypothetical protein